MSITELWPRLLSSKVRDRESDTDLDSSYFRLNCPISTSTILLALCLTPDPAQVDNVKYKINILM